MADDISDYEASIYDEDEEVELEENDEDFVEEEVLGEERVDVRKLFGDLDDITDDEYENGEVVKTIKEYAVLDENETELLPYSYIISLERQWKIVLDACMSNFRYVKDMGKVSNFVLRIVADAAALGLSKNPSTPKPNNTNFIKYALQRNI